MNILGAIIRRTLVKKLAKKAVKRRVGKFWEKNREMIMENYGGCYDSITPTGINRNQGAESTVACLLSFLNMCSLDNITEIDLGLKIIESE